MEVLQIPNEVLLPEVVALLEEGRSVQMRVKGNSMLPFIRPDRDSVVLVKPERYAEDDIALACIAPGRYVLHRIESVSDGVVTLRGTGNLTGTEKCRISALGGIVGKIVRPGGRETDCASPRFKGRMHRWAGRGYWTRRLFLGIYRRLL